MTITRRTLVTSHFVKALAAPRNSFTDQGFPEGSRGQDGAGTHAEKAVVLRLTRPLAKKFVEIAKAQQMLATIEVK